MAVSPPYPPPLHSWLENGGPGLSRCISYEKWWYWPASYVSLPECTWDEFRWYFFPIDFMIKTSNPTRLPQKKPRSAKLDLRIQTFKWWVFYSDLFWCFSKNPEIFEEISHFEHFCSFQQKAPTKTQQVNNVDVGILVDDDDTSTTLKGEAGVKYLTFWLECSDVPRSVFIIDSLHQSPCVRSGRSTPIISI